MGINFQWDPEKAASNLRKHGISFEEAKQVFNDPLFLVFADLDHSFEERRFVMMGELQDGRLLIVSYTDRNEATRIISARPATRKERKTYESEC
jgi:uncharacterized protein